MLQIEAQDSWAALRRLLSGEKPSRLDRSAWRAVADLCRANRCSGLLHALIRDRKTKIPSWLEKTLKRENVVASAKSLASDQLLGKTLAVLAEANIDVLPVKGAFFRHLLYADPGARESVDIDLLVRPAQYDQACRSLELAGFMRVPFKIDRPVTAEIFHERAFAHPDFRVVGCMVEVHCGFGYEDRYPIDVGLIFDRSLGLKEFCRRVGIEPPRLYSTPFDERGSGSEARFMTPEHALVHQFVHNASHNFHIPLLSVMDAKLMVEKWRPDWKEVIELARKWRLSAAGYFTLRLARDCLAAPVPESVLEALEPALARRKWLELFIATQGALRLEPAPDAGRGGPGRNRPAPRVAFFRYTNHLRLQQALVGLPLIDGVFNALRFSARYLKLRVADLAAWLR